MFISKNTQLIGLDIGSHAIKLVQLKKKKNSFELMNFGLMPLPPDSIVDGVVENVEAVSDAIKRLILCEKIKTKYAAVSVSGESVIIKKISVPVMDEAALSESIRSEAEQYIPYDIDEVNVDFHILPQDANQNESGEGEEAQMDVILTAVKKDVIESRLEVLTAAGLKPIVVDLDVFAIENSYEISETFDSEKVSALVNIGSNSTNINIVEGGVTAFTRDLPLGANIFNHAIQKELNVNTESAEQLKLGTEVEGVATSQVGPIIINTIMDLTQEIFKSFEFYSTARNKEVDNIILCGGGAIMTGLDRLISEKLNIPTETFNPFLNMKVNYKTFDADYLNAIGSMAAVSVGLASRRFNDRS